MRLGRIILAVLAPLFSVSTTLNAELPLSADSFPVSGSLTSSLLDLLRAVHPMMAAASSLEEREATQAAHHVPAPLGSPAHAAIVNIASPWSPATAAALHLLTRQQQRPLLRC